MRTRYLPDLGAAFGADAATLAIEHHSVTTATEHEFLSDEARDAYAAAIHAIGMFRHRLSFPDELAALTEERYVPLRSRPVCRRCRSLNVTRDATAEFDAETGQWTLAGLFDCTTCQDCEAEDDDPEYILVAPAEGANVRIRTRKPDGNDPLAGRTGRITRPNDVQAGVYVKLDPRPGEIIEKVELVDLEHIELAA